MFTEGFNADLLAGMPSPYNGDIGDFVRHSQLISQHFSAATRDALQRLRSGRIRYHQFVDIPVTEAVPPTQTDYTARIPKQTFQCEGVIGAVSLDLGNLFGYEETSPYVIYDIYPVKGYEESRSFVNSKKMLSFHSDGSAHPALSPDYVLLYCLRSDPAARNLIVDLDVLVGALPSDVVDVLMQPVFKHLVSQWPERYQLKPILFVEDRDLAVQYDEDNVFGCNAVAISAQNLLNDRLRDVAAEIGSTDNSLLVIDNKRCVHARTSFTPRFDGTDRWIKGAFVTRSEVAKGTILRLALDELTDTVT